MARSDCAVIVSEGLTPRFAVMVDPSLMCRPGCPKTRWYPSTTPSSAVWPITQPPMKCAVNGTPTSSPVELPGYPLMRSARFFATWSAAGM